MKSKKTFQDLDLSDEILKAVTDLGFQEPSAIQAEAIPLILSGKDIIGHSRTGTGKTAAFAIPSLEILDEEISSPQILVLCPTRELVVQVAEEYKKLGKYKENFSVVAIYGGEDISRQFKALKKRPQVIVGTPGRTMDHMRRKTLDLSEIQMVILDEADEMLDMGFLEDMETILSEVPELRQTILFSATLSPKVMGITKRFQNSPKTVDVTGGKSERPKIQQIYFEIRENAKQEALVRLLNFHNPKVALVFCNTKVRVDEKVELLKSRGIFAEGLHGDLSQKQRDKVMSGFRTGSVSVLVATDVAGRGIDVSDVEAVFNYDMPRDSEDYIHRIGRTGRAGRKGIALSFVSNKELKTLRRIQDEHGFSLEPGKVPEVSEIHERKFKEFAHIVQEVATEGDLSEYAKLVKNLSSEGISPENLAAALFKLALADKTETYDDNVSFDRDPRDRSDRDRGDRNRGGRFSGKKGKDSRKPDHKQKNRFDPRKKNHPPHKKKKR
ncbi:DEAD/DEAH box helicase [Leptospira wolffii]|uniref:DEAD-box ATP-dependent RNA helicase RhpA n=1 Tax=Leptospira wolffii TaxID=409998 RepID=A0A2M9ZA79_9LEPT|nr:DEAD/DEAH box helicase [Leptospira wolffii]PJZ65303.1 RNA helicase [Leptospira wolffii]TGK64818.1 DEAD/DEAH box helicase [Leptospira wolffii]TGK76783.1 DEAD/DEAH box helicase [Leptospira wolffii]TGK77365.1 DEAD/DEAH box helicase [Leptospira wolffii]TGL26760.1 DEAD/DEAH box helicase [Leptospira wolffii]